MKKTKIDHIPEVAMRALCSALDQMDPKLADDFREAVTVEVSKHLGKFRFSDDYRHGVTQAHDLYCAIINTVEANYLADAVTKGQHAH